MDARTRALQDLIACRLPLEVVVERVRGFPWDSETRLVSLQVAHIMAVLRRFVDGDLSAAQVVAWAEALEGRDDVEFANDIVLDLVFRLSAPEINDDVTPELAATCFNDTTQLFKADVAASRRERARVGWSRAQCLVERSASPAAQTEAR